MPIGDLLASISGEKPTSSTSTVTKTLPSVPKRKADETLTTAPTKTRRTSPLAGGPSRQNDEHAKLASRPANRPRSIPPSIPAPKPTSASRPSERAAYPSTARSNKVSPTASTAARTAARGRPGSSNGRPASSDHDPRPEPKKRSFAEIMARAKAAQAAAPALGRIQHKTLGRGLTKKEREEAKAEDARKGKKRAKPEVGRGGSSASPARGNPAPPHGRDGQGRANSVDAGKPVNGKGKKAQAVEEKKPKKAAMATTGYTGTARPRPGGGAAAKPNGSRPAANPTSRPRPGDRPRPGGAISGSRRYEDEDDDLDDFIDYDEEEEPGYGYGGGGGGVGGGYDSVEEESDMEAGLSDIDQEERRAELYARREDEEEEALEKRRKREKEEKRKQLLETVRNRRLR